MKWNKQNNDTVSNVILDLAGAHFDMHSNQTHKGAEIVV